MWIPRVLDGRPGTPSEKCGNLWPWYAMVMNYGKEIWENWGGVNICTLLSIADAAIAAHGRCLKQNELAACPRIG